MIACLDVHYENETARAAAVLLPDWPAAAAAAEYVITTPAGGAYQPGQFYQRELAPLLAVIERIGEPVTAFVVDAYCYLDAAGAPGLGAYLYEATGRSIPVVGVAKSRYRGTTHAVELCRGQSARPLFVTAAGLDQAQAAAWVRAMAGPYRLPAPLKQVDRLARDGLI